MKAIVITLFAFLFNQVTIGENHQIESYLLTSSIQNQGMGNRICTYKHEEINQINFSVQVPYHLKALSIKALDLQLKIPYKTTLNGTLLQTGNEVFLQTMVKIGINKQLSESIQLGVHLSSLFERQGTLSKYHELFGTLNGQICPNDKAMLSFLIGNFYGADLKSKNASFESNMAFICGCEYAWNSQFNGSAEIGLSTNNIPTWSLGMSYQIVPTIHLFGGYQLNPEKPTWGLQVKKNAWTAMYAGNWHPILGVSSSCSLQYSW